MSGYVTPAGVIEEAAKAISRAWNFMHTNESLGRQRMLAGVVAPTIAGPAYAAGYRAGLEAARDALEKDGYFCPGIESLMAETERSEG